MTRRVVRPFIIAVEGNIGSGKTNFMNFFESNHSNLCMTVKEPVEKWRNVSGQNLLGRMYNDPQRWSLTFQNYVQLTMAQSHLIPCSKPIKIIERSLFSAKYCFVQNLKNSFIMSTPDYIVLNEWFNWLTENHDFSLDLIVYLRTSPEIVFERIKKRQRPEEEKVSLEYLKQLHRLHESWLLTTDEKRCDENIVNVDDNNIDKMVDMKFVNKETVTDHSSYPSRFITQGDSGSDVIMNSSSEQLYKPSNIMIINANRTLTEMKRTYEKVTHILLNNHT